MRISFLLLFILMITQPIRAQQSAPDTTAEKNQQAAERYLLLQLEQQKIDSFIAVQLKQKLGEASLNAAVRKSLEDSLSGLRRNDSARRAQQQERVTVLRKQAIPYPVILLDDTLFHIYNRLGSFSPAERANAVSGRLEKLYEDAYFNVDSLQISAGETTLDIFYKRKTPVLSVTEMDALLLGRTQADLAQEYLATIRRVIVADKQENSLLNWLKRLGYVVLIVAGIGIIVYAINRAFRLLNLQLNRFRRKHQEESHLKKLRFLTAGQLHVVIGKGITMLRYAVILLAIYLALPLLFNVFPQTEPIADLLIGWILTPVKAVANGVIDFLPNGFTIVIIYLATRYLIQLVRYVTSEIAAGNLHVSGFYADWAEPTFNIVRFLIYAFMLVIIFPYLPGSKSPAFQGVSVFLGILLSLGSSSAIANVVAGLVITYMRPFQKGDRVKIGEVVGDVTEKTMLVTRIRTIKNEDITVPNATILSNHTVNYSTNARETGLIIHTTVTIGYEVHWQKVHEVLLEAAGRTGGILKAPKPFVLQTSLDDFYAAYQINGYTQGANTQAGIYSELHRHILDCCHEAGIEMTSPHYRAVRDGSEVNIPTGEK